MIPSVYPLVGALACLALLAAIALAPCLKAFRRGWFLVATVASVLWAGTKPEPPAQVFSFNLGLHDAGSTYDATEGAAVARWTWDAPVAGYVFRGQYRINGGAWVQLPDYAVTDGTAVYEGEAGLENLSFSFSGAGTSTFSLAEDRQGLMLIFR